MKERELVNNKCSLKMIVLIILIMENFVWVHGVNQWGKTEIAISKENSHLFPLDCSWPLVRDMNKLYERNLFLVWQWVDLYLTSELNNQLQYLSWTVSSIVIDLWLTYFLRVFFALSSVQTGRQKANKGCFIRWEHGLTCACIAYAISRRHWDPCTPCIAVHNLVVVIIA
jgi:hypothetical protein